MKSIIKHISIANIVFVCFWVLGNSISANSHDYGFIFYLFALLSISFLVGYSSISILEIIKNKLIRVFIGVIIYAILLYMCINLDGKFVRWLVVIFIIIVQILLFYLSKIIIKYALYQKKGED